jgi:hypothetical protein
MMRRRRLQRNEKIRNAAVSTLCFAVSAALLLADATIPGGGFAEGAKGVALSAFFALFGVVNAVTLLPHRTSGDRPHGSKRKRPAELTKPTPPVDEEFERLGNAFFISATPYFMPRWAVHAHTASVIVPNLDLYALMQAFRPVLNLLAAGATRCLRKPWTVAVERRNISGAAEWRYVLREEYFSRREAYARRVELVSEWSTTFYVELPFVE